MPIRVVFLTFYFEAWDALAEVYSRMKADPRFEVTVVAISRRLTGEIDFDDAAEVSKFFTDAGIEHLVNADIPELNADYVFINYPWQRNYPKEYRAEALAKFTRIAYVPYYSISLVDEPGSGNEVAPHLYTQRSHQLASLIFVQTAAMREAYASTSRGNQHVHFVGSPKLDQLVNEVRAAGDIGGGLRMVWAPHHSYSASWLNFGTFAATHADMLRWATDHSEVSLTLRPHPFLFGTLVDREVMTAEALDEWIAAWNALPNTKIDTESSSAEIFINSDALITDGISYLAEYPLATGRPAFFIENPQHWKFSEIGELAAASSIRVESIDQIEIRNGHFVLGDRTEQIAALKIAAMPFDGESAARIVEVVAADFGADGSGSPLVDASQITEVAWEFQPGREPQID